MDKFDNTRKCFKKYIERCHAWIIDIKLIWTFQVQPGILDLSSFLFRIVTIIKHNRNCRDSPVFLKVSSSSNDLLEVFSVQLTPQSSGVSQPGEFQHGIMFYCSQRGWRYPSCSSWSVSWRQCRPCMEVLCHRGRQNKGLSSQIYTVI